jgi:hypothetical protein
MNIKSAATYGLFTEKPELNQPPISRRNTRRWMALLALVAGDYTVAWRVVSDDGHPLDGQFSYTLTKRALSHVRRSSAPPVVAAADSSPNRSWLTSGTGQLAIGAGVALVAFILVRFQRRRSR